MPGAIDKGERLHLSAFGSPARKVIQIGKGIFIYNLKFGSSAKL